jgi:large subunit ribosomal protein L31e
MAEENKILEREYVIPLRREWLKVEEYRRAGRAAKAIKKFIAKHMKVTDRNTDNVKLDMYLNNELWFRGKRHPPSKIKVRARKEGEIVKVEFVETPQYVKFIKAKHEKTHQLEEKKPEKAEAKEAVVEKKAEEKTEEEKKEEKTAEVEKEKAGEEKQLQEAKQEKKTAKHALKEKRTEIHRTSMNRH